MAESITKRAKVLGAAAGVVALVGVTACGEDGSVEAYCDVWEDLQDEFDAFEDPGMEALGEAFERLESGLGDAVSAAPDEIESETENMRDAISAINDLDIDFDDPEAMFDPEFQEELEQLEEQFSTMEQDAEAVEEFVDEHCEGVELS